MENLYIILMAVVGLLIAALLVAFIITRRGKQLERDYRSWFEIGVIWTPLGAAMALGLENPGLWFFTVLGLVFLVQGWRHKDQWRPRKRFSELSREEKRLKLIVGGVGITLLLLVGFFYALMRLDLI